MGYSLAEAFAEQGAQVDLVSGPVQITTGNRRITIHPVGSAAEMDQMTSGLFRDMDIIVFAAAVADYRPASQLDSKIRRTGGELILKLVPTEDISARIGRQRLDGQILVGFALESENGESNAARKLSDKNLDLIILNHLNDPGAGFNVDTNRIIIIGRNNIRKDFELKSKQDVAKDIVDEIFNLMI
jgi:phosphopantothenoylcysteine decarboxylase/phosphopantothenate--cysteine ligase